MSRFIVVTGTDTGVGKTLLTALLARHLRLAGTNAAALKPICSGGRDDARALAVAQEHALTLDEINPWHFRASIAPLLAARREGRRVTLADVVTHARGVGKRFETLLVEGAGGLLSPLGEGFDTRDLIRALKAKVIIVAPNRLGVVNQLLLTLEALPRSTPAHVVLMGTSTRDAASKSNARLLAEFMPASRVHELPWWKHADDLAVVLTDQRVRRVMENLVER